MTKRPQFLYLWLLLVAALVVACGGGSGETPSDANAPEPDQDAAEEYLDVTVECTPHDNDLDQFLEPLFRQSDLRGPLCVVTVKGGTPVYDVVLSAGNTDSTLDVHREEEMLASVEKVGWHLAPRAPGFHLVSVKATDTEGVWGDAFTEVVWHWNDADQIDVNIVEPGEAIEVEKGEAVAFAALFDAPQLTKLAPTTGDQFQTDTAIDLISDIQRYELTWDFADGVEVTELLDAPKGTASASHTFETVGEHFVAVTATDRSFGMVGSDRVLVDVIEPGGDEPVGGAPVWVLSETRVIPPKVQGEEFESIEGRPTQFWAIDLTESTVRWTSMSYHYDDDIHVTMEFHINPPPAALTPGETITIAATGRATTVGELGPGYTWWLHVPYPAKGESILIDPRGGESDVTGTYVLDVPEGALGDTLTVKANVSGLRCDGANQCEIWWIYEMR